MGEAVVNATQHFFCNGYILKEMNHTFITLIPKMEGTTKVEQFRLIALCNVIMKVFTKNLATKLRIILDRLIAPAQAAFIPNRNITNNTILNHEIMHYMNGRKGKLTYMPLKIDMMKAYDRVDWGVLKEIMRLHGFSPTFIKLVNECCTAPTYSVLLGGSPYGFFGASRGIRQGDPISPALFTLLFDLFSRILTKAELDGHIHGVKVARTSPPITHLIYADDLVVYCRATIDEARTLLKCLFLMFWLYRSQKATWI